MSQGEYGKAAEKFRASLCLDPNSPKVHNYLGLCYFYQKDY